MMVLPLNKIKQADTYLNPVQINLKNKLILPIEKKIFFLDFQNIIFAYSDGNYIYVITSDKKYFLAKTLKWLEERLPQDSFIRVHRSYIINVNQINNLDKSSWNIVMNNNEIVPVSKRVRSTMSLLFKQS